MNVARCKFLTNFGFRLVFTIKRVISCGCVGKGGKNFSRELRESCSLSRVESFRDRSRRHSASFLELVKLKSTWRIYAQARIREGMKEGRKEERKKDCILRARISSEQGKAFKFVKV